MKNIMNKVAKKALVIILSVITFGSAIFSSIAYAYGISAYQQLGSNAALGSPILNTNFTTDQWNKWETVCWGVFLSNFCVPLLDNYKTAFTTGNGGSDGAGYKALCFGSGNDAENNDVIKNFCNYAVNQQETSGVNIYVTYSYIRDSEISASGDVTDEGINNEGGSQIREAKFQDLFMIEGDLPNSEEKVKNSVDEIQSRYKVYDTNYFTDDANDYSYIMKNYEGTFPTFWVKTNNGKYAKIFDYKDPWDIQVSTLMISKALSSDRKDEFLSSLESYYNENSSIRFDCFGNITTNDNTIIIPGSTNRNLTKSESINLVNSFVMNGNAENVSNDNLIEGIHQYLDESWLGSDDGATKGASPALAGHYSTITEGSTYLYYDFDNVAIKHGSSEGIGKVYSDLFDSADISTRSQKYNLKIEAANTLRNVLGSAKDTGSGSSVIAENQIAASLISTYINLDKQPSILSEITMSDGSKVSIFGDRPIVVNPQLLTDPNNSNGAGIKTRQLYNFFYQCYMGNIKETTVGALSTTSIKQALKNNVKYSSDLKDFLRDSKIWDAYKRYKGLDNNEKYNMGGIIELGDYCGNESFNVRTPRTLVLYPTSNVFRSVGNILGLVEGTEFSLYSTYIYITYLDFYKITHSSSILNSGGEESDFKPELFNLSTDVTTYDPNEAGAKSKEELEKELLNYSYLMLNPTAGRAYRTQLITNGLSDWIYDNYKRIVFGTATTDGSSISTKSNSGFLKIDTYLENPLTAPFLDLYSDVALVAILFLILIMVFHGLISGKKVSWFVITLLTIVNIILVTPSMGELVPYLSSEMVQEMFTNKMTYWAVSEAISNSSIEADAVSQNTGLEGLNDEESKQIAKLVKTLNMVYLDRSLMIKKDISSKITQKVEGTYNDIQSIASARWLLPTIMRQFSASNSDDAYNYVYTSLGDLYDDLSNIYWYYNPIDATINNDTKPTLTSGQNAGATKVEDLLSEYTNAIGKFDDFIDYTYYDNTDSGAIKRKIEFQSTCYKDSSTNPEDLIHTYSYILTDLTIPNRQGLTEYGTVEFNDITEVMEKGIVNDRANQFTDLEGVVSRIESSADQYDRTDRSTVRPEYSYLLATESPAHYFYQLVKDTFRDESNPSLGALIGSLQGQFGKDKNGKEVRKSFMHATEIENTNEEYPTGYVRDVLDLQNLFSNMVPYMYQLQITTGGMDGEGGALRDIDGNPLKIQNLSLYEGQNVSWLFRSNWVVKLIECPEYNKPMTVKDADDNRYTVSNPILPECYPSERPMVYSEAQKEAYGLHDSDLNIVELKCIEANKKVVNKWTMLINFAGTSNITMEILERQMALDATLIFDEVFSPSGVFNASYAMYPQTIDLRNISFDSVMKMIMLNVSKDTSYIYGDTMAALINTTDVFTSLLLLIVAFLCAYIIPGFRTLLMAAIFYLGYLAIFKAIFASPKYKAKVACGQLISNILFLVITFLFYFVFYLLINITSADEVLITSQASIAPGNPVWSLIFVLLACGAYIWAMAVMLNFCFKNYRDMGMEVYSMVAHTAVDRVKSGIRGIRADLGKNADAEAAAAKQNAKTGTQAGNANRSVNTNNEVEVSVTTESYDSKGRKVVSKNKVTAEFKKDNSYAMNDSNIKEYDQEATTQDIDNKIKRGAEKPDRKKK